MRLATLFVLIILVACNQENKVKHGEDGPLFRLVPADSSNIHFANHVQQTLFFNLFNYNNIYSGGGVAVGDINNDGLPDIYFAANSLPNRLYLNKGNLTFEDITEKAGVVGRDIGWCTGVSMVDINSDGLLDIYVCRSGSYPQPYDRENLLYVNNGDLTFTERGREYGLNDAGYSIQAYFFRLR